MSPTNLVLEEVPFAILEAVKLRIMASRKNLGKPPESTRPRPQFRKFGANSKKWRKPQYAAGSFDDYQDAVFYFDFADANCYPGTGTAIADLGPLGNNGIISGTVDFDSLAGGCLYFNGSGVVLVSATAPDLVIDESDGTVAYSYAAWVKISSFNEAINQILSLKNAMELLVFKWDNGARALGSSLPYGHHPAFHDYDSSLSISSGQWYHVAFTYKYPGNAVFYINGTQSYSIAADSGAFGADITEPFMIGGYIEGPASYVLPLRGYIGAVAAYQVELTAAQVAELYAQSSARFT